MKDHHPPVLLIGALICIFLGFSNDTTSGVINDNCMKRGTEGGPCTYRSYPGEALITRIIQTPATKEQAQIIGGPGYEGFEVWFKFIPHPTDSDQPAQLTNQEQLFTLRNSWFVGPRFLEKYELSPGKSVACEMSVLERGTCSPIQFHFPNIQNADYFESKTH